MLNTLKQALDINIKSRTGFAFEDFINQLFLSKYGTEVYIPIRRVKDQGSDGVILATKTCIACYAPTAYDKAKFEKKVEDDFKSYKTNWEAEYPNWMVITNHDVGPDQLKKVTSLKKGSTILGKQQLIKQFDELKGAEKRKIARFLNIESVYAIDYLQEIVEDVIADSTTNLEDNIAYKKSDLTEISQKIELNYSEEDIEAALDEYETFVELFHLIAKLIQAYEDQEKDKLKYKIKRDYNRQEGSFKQRLENLTDLYLHSYADNPKDDEYLYFIRAILVYLFEQCLIGKKVNS